MNKNISESDTLRMYVIDRLSKGRSKIKELSIFENELSNLQIQNIREFQNEEFEFLKNTKSALLLLQIREPSHDNSCSEKLVDEYIDEVNTFAVHFPI